MTGLSSLLLFLGTVAALESETLDVLSLPPKVERECTEIRDVVIIVEIPTIGRTAAINQTKIFITTLANKVSDLCLRPRIQIADQEIVPFNEGDCYSKECILNSVEELNGLEEELKSPMQLKSKDVIMHVLKDLEKEAGESDGLSLLNAPKKIVLLILSNQRKDGVYIPDNIDLLLESGYDFVAVGIGKGRNEPLDRISFRMKMYMENFEQLNDNYQNDKLISWLQGRISGSNNVVREEFNLGRSVDVAPGDQDQYVLEIVQDKEVCKYVVDICFLIDSSGSINKDKEYIDLKRFVMEIAARFNISADGAHASAVVFSDFLPDTKVAIRLNEHKTTESFKNAVANIPYLGHRTRIDLAFKLVEEDVFTKKNGARDGVSKVIFLLTDGRQFPTKENSIQLDPVKSAQKLIDDGVQIFVVGIGKKINDEQLASITQDKAKVFHADTWEVLKTKLFVKQVSSKSCNSPGLRPTPVTRGPTAKPGCKGVGTCDNCCGSRDVYINIFQAGSGPNYVLQGMKLQKSPQGTGLSGVNLNTVPTVDVNKADSKLAMEQLMCIIKAALPGKTQLVGRIEKLVQNSKKMKRDFITVGRPAVAEKKRRKRRSVNTENTHSKKLDVLSKFAKTAGCNMFLTSLKNRGVLKRATKLMTEGKNITIFCPVDDVYEKVYGTDSFAEDEQDILLNHIGWKHDEHGTMYQTLLPGGKIVFNPIGKETNKVSWKANGVDTMVSIRDGTQTEMIITKDIIYPSPLLPKILHVLKVIENVTIFNDMLLKSGIMKVFNTTNITKICFAKDICVPVTKSMQRHLTDAATFNQFTILVPTNSVFGTMATSKLKALMEDSNMMREFLQEHVFLGTLGNRGSNHKEVAFSLSPNHSLVTMTMNGDKTILTDGNDRLFQIKYTLPVVEGMLHIVEEVL